MVVHLRFNQEFAVSRSTQEFPSAVLSFHVHGSHVLWLTIPRHSAIQHDLPGSYNPQTFVQVWAIFRVRSSLTDGISFDFFSSPYVRYFSSGGNLSCKHEYLAIKRGEFPHSDTAGSTPVRRLPDAIVVYNVLHRLVLPRHPPFACSKTLSKLAYFPSTCLIRE